jgi:GDP-L-fucose synthase
MADACVFLMSLPDDKYCSLLGSDEAETGRFEPPLVNIGVGEDVSIGELAEMVKSAVGFQGEMVFDTSKPDGPPRKLMDVGKLSAMGWRAKVDLKIGIRQVCSVYTNHK